MKPTKAREDRIYVLERDVREACDLDDPSDEVQAARDKNVDGLIVRALKAPDDVDCVLYGGQDVDVLFWEFRRQVGPCRRERVLRLELSQVRFRYRLRSQVCRIQHC